jgi:transcriptional regulator with GAF, ATPase, and Fis domain
MDRTDNNITKAAKLLGLTFRTLQYRLEKFGIKKDGGEGTEEEAES